MRMRNLWGALGLLGVGLVITVITSLYIKAGVESAAQREFDFACKEIRLSIVARLDAGAQILRSGVALFDTTERVSRGEWRTFTRRLQIEQHLPGIQGIGFAPLIPRSQLNQHVPAIRGEGFPDYQVRPAGERETYAPVIYLEPFDDRNQRAFGYDMFSEPVRRAAMERARDENTAALSGKVILLQETGKDVQAGVLMYLPVFRHGLPIDTLEQRRAAIQGWVYSPYRMTDLMRGTLRNWDAKQDGKQISLQIYDGAVLSAAALLYDSQGTTARALDSSARGARLTPVNFAGHRWTLRFTQPGGLVSSVDYGMAWLVLFGGTMSTLLLFGLLLWRQQRIQFYRDKAEAGEALISSEERFRIAAENLTDVVYEWDVKDKIAWYGDIDSITGYPPGQFPRTHGAWAATLHPDDKDRVVAALEAHVNGVAPYNVEYRIRKKDGEWRWWSARGTALKNQSGKPYKMIGSITDITERKRAEKDLRDSEERYRALAEHSADGILIAGLETKMFKYANPAICRMLGYTENELRTMGISNIVPTDDLPHVAAEFAAQACGAKTLAPDIKLVRKDGTVFYADINSTTIPFDGGLSMLGICHDITERKQAEKALRQSEERFRQVAESAGEWIWEVDAEYVYRYCSSASETLVGYTPAELVGRKHFYDLFIPEVRDGLKAAALAAFDKRASFRHFVNPNLHKNGTTVIMETSGAPILDEKGVLLGYRGTDTDITQRVQAEANLRVQVAAMEATAEAILIADRNAIVTWVNNAFSALTGYTAADIIGRPASILAPEHVPDAIYERIQTALSAGKVWRGELLSRRKDDSLYTEEITITPVRDEAGVVNNHIAIKKDVTERKRQEGTLREQQKLASIGTLARGMAHEINNPIMGVLSYAQLIKDKAADNAALVEFADEIIAEIRRVASMTHSLLSFTQQQNVQPVAPTAWADVVAAVLPLAEDAARAKGITLSCDIPADLPPASCHQGQLGQAVTALLTNAIEAFDDWTLDPASPEPMRGKRRGAGNKVIHLTAQQIDKADRAWVSLTVADNGPGIPATIRERVFDPFFTTKDRTKHSGLGLWISRSIAQEHGGALTYEGPSAELPSSPGSAGEERWTCEVGHGARFHLDIPVVQGRGQFNPSKKDCHEQDTDR